MKRFCVFFLAWMIFSNVNAGEVKPFPEHKIILEEDYNPKFPLRKYTHVQKLYARLADPILKLCVENRVPPGAILSILSLESGWGSGYVGKITGNFLSLNAVKGVPKLPALYLPTLLKTNEILFDENEIKKHSAAELQWKKRPASLKKDYRPSRIAGTKKDLGYFNKHPKELTKANIRNVKDFVNAFISKRSKIAAYREARALLDAEIEKHGINVLFEQSLNEKFIHTIGGRPNSYNYRETWPLKVVKIMKTVGAVELSKEMYVNKKTFTQAW